MKGHIFRQYDIRGIVGEELTEEVARDIGRAVGTHLKERNKNKIVVGRDVRNSSLSLKNELVEGILSTGCGVIDVGIVPTPLLYFSIYLYSQGGGVMVTGSHNPPEYNGFKICKGLDSIYGEEIQRLRRMIEDKKFIKGTGTLQEKDPKDEYIEFLLRRVKIKKPLKLIIDAGNGTAGLVVPSLMKRLNLEFECLYCNPDGNFPHHLPDPTIPQYMEDLIKEVKEKKGDIGIGYDGDSDRIGAVDDRGRIIWGDKLLCLYARKLLERNPGARIIMDIKCSSSVVEYIERYGGKPIMWKTGHSLIKEKMKKEDVLLAGEMSGHMFFKDNYLGYDDAIFASLRLIEILSESEKKFSELVNEIPYYSSTPEIRVDCPDDKKFECVEELKKYFKSQYKTIDIDGVRILFENGWGLIRASNTQPILVLRFEGKTEESREKIKNIVMEKLKDYSYIDLKSKILERG